jgi:Transmembrane domain of unknown function (DUF3566)
MTQSPGGGPSAPVTSDFQTAGGTRQSTSELSRAGTAAQPGTPSPSTPASSTPWGTTSTSTGSSDAHGAESGMASAPTWTSTPISPADAPTASVPLVQERPADGLGSTGLGAPANSQDARVSRPRGPRRARLQLRHINPWTVLKFSCVLSIALFFVWLIVVGVLFGVLDGAGVIGKINDAYTTIQGSDSNPPVTAGVVFGGAAIIGVVNIVLFIALSTVGSVVYNLCADLVGGIEITLSER